MCFEEGCLDVDSGCGGIGTISITFA